jgi:hypothetical protein
MGVTMDSDEIERNKYGGTITKTLTEVTGLSVDQIEAMREVLAIEVLRDPAARVALMRAGIMMWRALALVNGVEWSVSHPAGCQCGLDVNGDMHKGKAS